MHMDLATRSVLEISGGLSRKIRGAEVLNLQNSLAAEEDLPITRLFILKSLHVY